MSRRSVLTRSACTLAAVASSVAIQVQPAVAGRSIHLQPIGTYESGIFDGSAAEIPAFDPATSRLFVVNGAADTVDVLDLAHPTSPSLLFALPLASYGKAPTSVAVHQGVVAVAVENEDKQAPGSVVLFDTDGNLLNQLTVGALPDMVTFTPNGKHLLVANEGEPSDDYTVDPEGSVSIIDLGQRHGWRDSRDGIRNLSQDDVRTADFHAFNNATLDSGIRIFGPGATVAQDLEPEYIAVSEDSQTAWVTLQENNAMAVVDIKAGKVTELIGLGTKDHSLSANALDASNDDGAINITTWPVKGMYQPDAIASYTYHGRTYLVCANEGDSRDYDGYSEEERVKDVALDPTAFADAFELQQKANLGRLKITTANGDTDRDGDFDELYSFGGRSFSIRTASGELVYDSGDDFEQITAKLLPTEFNATNDENDSFDDRSDDKGPEPEGVTLGRVHGHTYAFVGLERIGGIMVYDISVPYSPRFVEYVNTRNFQGDPQAGTAGDLAPEGMVFIPRRKSPIREPLLVVANEVSGSTTIYAVQTIKK